MTLSSQTDGCTCLTHTQLTQMMTRNEVVQSREPCPVHGEPDLPPGTFVPRIEHDGPMEFPVIRRVR
jgi:hypothetical protein